MTNSYNLFIQMGSLQKPDESERIKKNKKQQQL